MCWRASRYGAETKNPNAPERLGSWPVLVCLQGLSLPANALILNRPETKVNPLNAFPPTGPRYTAMIAAMNAPAHQALTLTFALQRPADAPAGRGEIRRQIDADGLASLHIAGEITGATDAGQRIARLMAEGYPAAAGAISLDYAAIPPVLRLMGIARAAWPDLFAAIQIMERAALAEINRER